MKNFWLTRRKIKRAFLAETLRVVIEHFSHLAGVTIDGSQAITDLIELWEQGHDLQYLVTKLLTYMEHTTGHWLGSVARLQLVDMLMKSWNKMVAA